MDARAVRWVVVAVALGGMAAPARRAVAFTMGEQMATTGVANTLAGNAAPSAASTIGSVKNKLSSSTGPKSAGPGAPKVGNVAKVSGLGAGKPTHKRTASGKTGWGDAKGWAKNGKGGGGGKSGKSGWTDSGGWPKSDGWVSKGAKKTWADAGGGSWARPGNKG
jgi:hypothetical protein